MRRSDLCKILYALTQFASAEVGDSLKNVVDGESAPVNVYVVPELIGSVIQQIRQRVKVHRKENKYRA